MSNLGDYRTWRDVERQISRSDYSNQASMTNIPFPGDDVVYVPEPERNFCYFWQLDSKDPLRQFELDQLLDKGYEKVINTEDGGQFRIKRPWRHDANGVYWGGHILYAIPAETWEAAEKERLRREDAYAAMDRETAGVHTEADKLGLGSFVERNGKLVDVVKPKKR